jgi:hypothetical protein
VRLLKLTIDISEGVSPQYKNHEMIKRRRYRVKKGFPDAALLPGLSLSEAIANGIRDVQKDKKYANIVSESV